MGVKGALPLPAGAGVSARKEVGLQCVSPALERHAVLLGRDSALLLEEWAESSRQWSALAVKALVILNVLF